MTSVKLKLRRTSGSEDEGILYYQVVHGGTVRQISTGCRIFSWEWDEKEARIIIPQTLSDKRCSELECIGEKAQWGLRCLHRIAGGLETAGLPYSVEDIISRYHETAKGGTTVFGFIRQQVVRLKRNGRSRTAGTYQETLNSLMKFRANADFCFSSLDADMMERYEAWMRARHLCRNTTSFYMRILRTLYNLAVADGLAPEAKPFKNVYTGIDKTAKRAITFWEVRRIKELDLSGEKPLDFARDMFLLSFYLRGMSFVDLAYLRKSDLSNGFVTYNRRKTGQQLVIRWEKQMQQILDKYEDTHTRYLLPIILREDGTEEKQYLNRMLLVNRRLKKVAAKADLKIPLTIYVALHKSIVR